MKEKTKNAIIWTSAISAFAVATITLLLVIDPLKLLHNYSNKSPKSAYEIAVENGYKGTEEEWIKALVSGTVEDGKSAYEIAVENGYKGSETEWLASLVGEVGKNGLDGKSAYELAKDQGYSGTLSQWLDSLVGKDGVDGSSAYELAVENGYKGTMTEWLASLVGADGTDGADGLSAYELAVKNGYKGSETEWLASLAGENGTNGTDGESAYYIAVKNGYTGTEKEWLQSLVGAAGKDGTNGTNGKSAYELAVEGGYKGTLQEWLQSLVGTDGKDGTNGTNGTNGKSAYEIAVENGYKGTEKEWVDSLTGPKGLDGSNGKSAYELAQQEGYKGTLAEWLADLAGKDGAAGSSAYDIAVENGYEGTVTDWLASLVGKDGTNGTNGTNGKSAYEIAVAGGYKGTETEWLASLAGEAGKDGTNGADGKSAYEIAVGKGYAGTEEEWLKTLVGANGKSAYELAQDNGYNGTLQDWLASLVGADGKDGTNGTNGKSAYEIAKEHGYNGTEAEWVESLAGKDGTDGINGANGKSAFELAQENGFKGDLAAWLESLRGTNGDKGETGATGADGKSAYDIAVENGYEGTVTDWLASLVGKDGTNGTNGTNGKSAYEIAVAGGYKGTETEWLASLAGEAGKDGTNGADGKSAYEIAVGKGYAGTEEEWLKTLVGATGKSAFELAQDNGYSGTVQEWLESLVGTDGTNGKSAYELAVANGYTGTEVEWIASLAGKNGTNGTNGKSAYELAVENGFVGDVAAWINSLRGEAGNKWFTGEGEPVSVTAKNGDLYYDTTSGDIYTYSADTWSLISNIKGSDGATWMTGNGIPTLEANESDLYLDLLTSDVYRYESSALKLIGNIKGISVSAISIEDCYDEEGKHYVRYTFEMTDNTKKVIDVYDNLKAIEILNREYRVQAITDPTAVPNIEVITRFSDGTYIQAPLTRSMIVNFNEVHFTEVGSYNVLIYYYGCYGHINVVVYDESNPQAMESSHLNYDTIVWSNHNYENYTGLYLHVDYHNPNYGSEDIPLDDPRIQKTNNGNNVEITFLNITRTLTVYRVDDFTLTNSKVTSLNYYGDTIYWNDKNFGYLVFEIQNVEYDNAYYIRDFKYDDANSKFIDELYFIDYADTPTAFTGTVPNNYIGKVIGYEVKATLEPGITNRKYFSDNLAKMVVSNGGTMDGFSINKVTFSKNVFVPTDTFPEVNAEIELYNSSADAYDFISIPLTKQVTKNLDFSTPGLKDFTIEFKYMGKLFTYNVHSSESYNTVTGIKVVEPTDYLPDQLMLPNKQIIFNAREGRMKVTSEPGAVPTIIVDVKYESRHGFSDYVVDCTDVIVLTKESILNEQYLDFSVEGSKEIKFNYRGLEKSVTIEFYDVDLTNIESISNLQSKIDIYKGDSLIDKLYEANYGRTLKITYFESKNGVLEKDIVINDRQFIIDHFDISNYVDEIGTQYIYFKYKEEGDEVGYISMVTVNVFPREETAEEYLYKGNAFSKDGDYRAYFYLDESTNELYISKLEIITGSEYFDYSGMLKQEVLDDPNLKQEVISKYFEKLDISNLNLNGTLSVVNGRELCVDGKTINVNVDISSVIDETTGEMKWNVLGQTINPSYTSIYTINDDGSIDVSIDNGIVTKVLYTNIADSYLPGSLSSINYDIEQSESYSGKNLTYKDFISISIDNKGVLVVSEKENLSAEDKTFIESTYGYRDLMTFNNKTFIQLEVLNTYWDGNQWRCNYSIGESSTKNTELLAANFEFTFSEDGYLIIDGIKTSAMIKSKFVYSGADNVRYKLYFTDENGENRIGESYGIFETFSTNENGCWVINGIDTGILTQGKIIDYPDDHYLLYKDTFFYYEDYKVVDGKRVVKVYNLFENKVEETITVFTPEMLDYLISNGLYSYIVLDPTTKEISWYEEQPVVPTNTNVSLVKETNYQCDVSQDILDIFNIMGSESPFPQTFTLTLCDDDTAKCDVLFGEHAIGCYWKNDKILMVDQFEQQGFYFELTDPDNKVFTLKLGLTSDPTTIKNYTIDEATVYDMVGGYNQLLINSFQIDQDGNGFIKLFFQEADHWQNDGSYNTSGNWYSGTTAPTNPTEKINNTYFLSFSNGGTIYRLSDTNGYPEWEWDNDIINFVAGYWWNWTETVPTEAPVDGSTPNAYINSSTYEIYIYNIETGQWDTKVYSDFITNKDENTVFLSGYSTPEIKYAYGDMYCDTSTNEVYQFTNNYIWEKLAITDATITSVEPENPVVGDVYVNSKTGSKYTFVAGTEIRENIILFEYKYANSNKNIIIPVGRYAEMGVIFEISDAENKVYARRPTGDYNFKEEYVVDCTELSNNQSLGMKMDNTTIVINADGSATLTSDMTMFNPDTNEYITEHISEPMKYIWATDSAFMLFYDGGNQLEISEGAYIYFEKTGDNTLELRFGKPFDKSFNIDVTNTMDKGLPEGAVVTATGKFCYGFEYGSIENQLEIKTTIQYYSDVQHANVEDVSYEYIRYYQLGSYGRIDIGDNRYLELSKTDVNTYVMCYGDPDAMENYILEDGSTLSLYKDGTTNIIAAENLGIKYMFSRPADDIIILNHPIYPMGPTYKIEGNKAIEHVDPFKGNDKFTKYSLGTLLASDGIYHDIPVYVDEATEKCYVIMEQGGEVIINLGSRIGPDTYKVAYLLGNSFILQKVGNQMVYKTHLPS